MSGKKGTKRNASSPVDRSAEALFRASESGEEPRSVFEERLQNVLSLSDKLENLYKLIRKEKDIHKIKKWETVLDVNQEWFDEQVREGKYFNRLDFQIYSFITRCRRQAVVKIANADKMEEIEGLEEEVENLEIEVSRLTDSLQESRDHSTKLQAELDALRSNKTAPPTTKKRRSRRPVVLIKEANPQLAISKIKEKQDEPYELKLFRDEVKIYPSTEDGHLAVVRYAEENQKEYYAPRFDQSPPIKVILKGLPVDFDVETLNSELEAQGKKPLQTKQFRGKNGLLPVFCIQLPSSDENRRIYDASFNIAGFIVRTERLRRKRGPIQCFRCQRWGHSSYTCNIKGKCKYCADDHRSKDCTKKDEPPTCANCRAAHPASSLDCPRRPRNATDGKTAPKKEVATKKRAPTRRRSSDILMFLKKALRAYEEEQES